MTAMKVTPASMNSEVHVSEAPSDPAGSTSSTTLQVEERGRRFMNLARLSAASRAPSSAGSQRSSIAMVKIARLSVARPNVVRTDPAVIRDNLDRARREGQVWRLRSQVPLLVVGFLLLVSGTLGEAMKLGGVAVRVISFVMADAGASLLLLMPVLTQKLLSLSVFALTAVWTLTYWILAAVFSGFALAGVAVERGSAAECSASMESRGYDARCGPSLTYAWLILVASVGHVLWSVRTLFLTFRGGIIRTLIDIMWTNWARLHIFIFLITGAGAAFLWMVDDMDRGTGTHPALVLLGPLVWTGVWGVLMGRPGFRGRAQAFIMSRSQEMRAAASVASFIAGSEPEEVISIAKRSFRGISFDELCFGDIRENTPHAELYERSEPADFGAVDAFISHSWSDSAEDKWRALSSWCEAFKVIHHRPPVLWLDRACIDQTNISAAVKCLPVFLSGCNALVVIAGATYLSRLWCLVEIFCWVAMGGAPEHIQVLRISESLDAAAFDARNARCFKREDEEKLLTAVDAAYNGIDGFNDSVRAALETAQDVDVDELVTQQMARARAENGIIGAIRGTLDGSGGRTQRESAESVSSFALFTPGGRRRFDDSDSDGSPSSNMRGRSTTSRWTFLRSTLNEGVASLATRASGESDAAVAVDGAQARQVSSARPMSVDTTAWTRSRRCSEQTGSSVDRFACARFRRASADTAPSAPSMRCASAASSSDTLNGASRRFGTAGPASYRYVAQGPDPLVCVTGGAGRPRRVSWDSGRADEGQPASAPVALWGRADAAGVSYGFDSLAPANHDVDTPLFTGCRLGPAHHQSMIMSIDEDSVQVRPELTDPYSQRQSKTSPPRPVATNEARES